MYFKIPISRKYGMNKNPTVISASQEINRKRVNNSIDVSYNQNPLSSIKTGYVIIHPMLGPLV